MIAAAMAAHRSNSSGKWLAISLVAIGLVAAVVGWKFRRLDPAPARPAIEREVP